MWISVADQMKTRNNRQCRDRWHYHLKPDLKHKGDWSYEEDKIIVENQAIYGNHWIRIARLLPGRTENDIKNRWYSAMRTKKKKIADFNNSTSHCLKSELTDYAGCLRGESLTVQDLREGGKLKSISSFRSKKQTKVKYLQKSGRIRNNIHLNSQPICKDLSEGKGTYINNSAISMTETDGIFVPTIPMSKEYGAYNRICLPGHAKSKSYSHTKTQNSVEIADETSILQSYIRSPVIDETSLKLKDENVAKFSREEKGNFQDTNSKICPTTHAIPQTVVSSCNEKSLGDLKKSFNDAKKALQLNNSTSGTHNSCISSFALNDPNEMANCNVTRNHSKIFFIEPIKTLALQHCEPNFCNPSAFRFSVFPGQSPYFSLANFNQTILSTDPVFHT